MSLNGLTLKRLTVLAQRPRGPGGAVTPEAVLMVVADAAVLTGVRDAGGVCKNIVHFAKISQSLYP